jgi:hypothetical protein
VGSGVRAGEHPGLRPDGGRCPTTRTFELVDVDLADAISATLNFNASTGGGDQLRYRFNGNEWRIFDVPNFGAADGDGHMGRALSVPMSLADLVNGHNVLDVEQSVGGGVMIGNIDVTLEVPR